MKWSMILLSFIFAYAGIYAVVTIALPEIIEGMTFLSVTGKDLSTVQDPGFLKAYLIISRHEGFFALTTVIACYFILFSAFRKNQCWAWWALLAAGIPAWGWGLVDSLSHGAMLNFVLHMFGLVIFLAGLMVPVRAFFPRNK